MGLTGRPSVAILAGLTACDTRLRGKLVTVGEKLGGKVELFFFVSSSVGAGASASVGALHVLLGGAAQPYPKRLPVYFASGKDDGLGYPLPGPFLF